ncbi:MAG: HNH endonuclease [Methyloglobulus sp.]
MNISGFQEDSSVGLSNDHKTLIDKYEEDYKSALKAIDSDVKELIENGKEMKALLLFSESLSSIVSTHESLHTFYSIIYNHQSVLQHFKSERLKQLGHEPKATFDLLKNANAPQEEIEKHVVRQLAIAGFAPKHWYIKERVLAEIEYMIEALRILVEPDFIPFEDQTDDDLTSSQPERFVPSSVKIAVWRRDNGKCVECGSNEKLEYDHIIPVSKDGSNTERNIQLLCEKCNRKKSANIQ